MEDRIYSQSPSRYDTDIFFHYIKLGLARFPINTAYVEGWGLYSEKLGYDIGVYSEPLDRFGHLSEEIFRACRLVVDTGLHALGWTEEEALQFMLSHTAASEESLRSEIARYLTWPGQATAYKVSTPQTSLLLQFFVMSYDIFYVFHGTHNFDKVNGDL